MARIDYSDPSTASDRTREIQSALIQQRYLSGEPTGKMDQSTKDALTKFQADNGWQTKLMPDSRAIIKLGLGPSKSTAPTSAAGGESAHSLSETASTKALTQQ